jgi:ArsR family transcriptional regulator, arsenate/arsenite/antimonite-responsive transcriptional repressor
MPLQRQPQAGVLRFIAAHDAVLTFINIALCCLLAMRSVLNVAGPSCCGGSPARPKDAKPYAGLFKALGDETRLEVLALLAAASTRELCVCEIERHFELSQPTVSHHLRILRDANLVTAERRGTWVYYALRRDTLAQLGRFAALLGV